MLKVKLKMLKTLKVGELTGILVENIDDGPYLKDPSSPGMVALFTKILFEVKNAVSLPLGVYALKNIAKTALP